MHEAQPIRMLIVDDEQIVRQSLCGWFEQGNYQVDTASSGQEALAKLARHEWDLFLLDIRMPGMDGLELQRKIKEVQPDATVIIMTAYAAVDTAVEAMKQGAYDYIVKPFDPDDLERLIHKAVERRLLLLENNTLRTKLKEFKKEHELVGASQVMAKLQEQISLVSTSDTTVLIRGESGTGKELVARAIHQASPRALLPIVIVNCGSLAEGVLESELFGHEKGAFTGAQYRRKGKFEQADGGTLFLDEIGDISLKTQVDLLRVLEEKKISRVGGNASFAVNFRLITATNRNLEDMVAEGRFRQDLYYRLNVFPIIIPPLREHTEDIPVLASHFIDKFSRAMNKEPPKLSSEAELLLLRHAWPGNIRELQNAIERAVLLCSRGILLPAHLPFAQGKVDHAANTPLRTLEETERQQIAQTLDETKWNISQAARILGIDRVTLYNKIKKYNLKGPDSSP